MPLSGPEIGRLSQILTVHFTRMELGRLLTDRLDQRLASFPDGGSMDEFAYAVVTAASRQEWHKGLLFQALLARPAARELEAFANIQRLAGRPDAFFPRNYFPQDDLKTCFIGQRHPFLDREDVRSEVAGMLDDSDTRIVRLEGPEGIGKSYVTSFIRVLQRTRRSFDLAAVEVGSLGPRKLGCTVEKLIQEICRQVRGLEGAVYTPEQTAQETRQADSRLDKLRKALVERNAVLWLVLDAFEGVLLPQPTVEAIQSMIEWASGPLKDDLRLIVVGGGEHLDLSTSIPVQLPALERSHLKDFFTHLVQDQGDTIQPAALELAIDAVEGELGEAGYGNPEDLCGALTRTLEQFRFLPRGQD